MTVTTRERNKRKLVIDWLQSLSDDGLLNVPIHQMSIEEWHQWFNDTVPNTDMMYGTTVFSDKRFFTLQMNNIHLHSQFPGFSRTLKKTRDEYILTFTVTTEQPIISNDAIISDKSSSSDDESLHTSKFYILLFYTIIEVPI